MALWFETNIFLVNDSSFWRNDVDPFRGGMMDHFAHLLGISEERSGVESEDQRQRSRR